MVVEKDQRSARLDNAYSMWSRVLQQMTAEVVPARREWTAPLDPAKDSRVYTDVRRLKQPFAEAVRYVMNTARSEAHSTISISTDARPPLPSIDLPDPPSGASQADSPRE